MSKASKMVSSVTWQETHPLECSDAPLGCIEASPTHAFFWLCRTTAFWLILSRYARVAPRVETAQQGQTELQRMFKIF